MGKRIARRETRPSIACDLSSLGTDQRQRRRELQERLRADVQEVRELRDGYAFRHSSEASVLRELSEFASLERLCCPFFDFTIEVGRDGGPLWFRVTGGEEAKGVLEAELDSRTEGATDGTHGRESEGPGQDAPAQAG